MSNKKSNSKKPNYNANSSNSTAGSGINNSAGLNSLLTDGASGPALGANNIHDGNDTPMFSYGVMNGIGTFTDKSPDTTIGVADVDVNGLTADLLKNDALSTLHAKASIHLTRMINRTASNGDAMGAEEGNTSIAFADALFKANRHAFSRYDTEARGADEGSFYMRTRPNIVSAHLIRNVSAQVFSIEDIMLNSPMVVRVMSDDVERKAILDALTNNKVVNELTKWLISTGREAPTGTKRYTMQRLYRKLGSLTNTNGELYANERLLVMGRLLHEVIAQFDWRFTTLKVDKVIEPSVRLMEEKDITSLYVEGWISKHLPSSQYWVTKYQGDSRVTAASVEDVIISSFVNLKRQLMQATLLSNRVADVVALAKLKAAVDLGIIPSIGNETVAAILSSSADIADMATWYSIVSPMLTPNSTTKLNAASAALKTQIGDVNLFLKHASEVATCVREHMLVETVNVGDLIKHITVGHKQLGDGGIYHSWIKGSLTGVNNDYYHYIEDQVGQSIYSHMRVRENDPLTKVTSAVVAQLADQASNYLVERNDIEAYADLATLVDPGKMWGNAPYYLSVVNATSDEIKLLALLNSEIIVRYSTHSEHGDEVYVISDIDYVIRDVNRFLVNPYPLLDGDVYTKLPILAAVMNVTKDGSGVSYFIKDTLDEIKSPFITESIASIGKGFFVNNVPNSIMIAFAIADSKGTVQDATVKLATSNYITMNPAGDLVSYIPDALVAQSTLLLRALSLAASASRFANTSDLSFDDERNNVTFLIGAFDKLDGINLARHTAYDMRYEIARQLSNKVGAWNSVYHNIQVDALTRMAGANMPLRYLLSVFSDIDGSSYFNWFNDGYSNNRLFRDVILGKVK